MDRALAELTSKHRHRPMVELSGRVATAGVQALRPARDARPYVRLNVLVDRFETDATYLSNYLIKLEC